MDKLKDFFDEVGDKIENAIGFGKPSADVARIHIPHISLQKAEIVLEILVKNPNPLPIPLVDINYCIESDGRNLISGLIPDAGTINARGSETVKIPISLIYNDIKETYHDIRSGSIIPYGILVDLIINVPIFGRINFPLKKSGELPIPHKPDIDLERIKFDDFSWERTVATLHLQLDNKNDFDMGLKDLDYEVWLGDISIGGAQLERSRNLPNHEICNINLPITFKPMDFGSALWDMIRGKGTGYSMKGNINVDTPFGEMTLPISKIGGITRFQKNRGLGGSDDDDDDSDDED